MAFNLEEMTIDYKKMFRMVPTDRATLAQSGVINDLISSLTPGQLANLFPRYYRDRLPDIGTSSSGSTLLTGALSGGTTGRYGGRYGGSGDRYSPAPPPAPPSKSAQELAIERILKENGIIPQEHISTVTGTTAQILATIRGKESGGNYTTPNLAGASSATGAYQFTKGTWQGLTQQFGIGTEYTEARFAPPDIQDQIAAKYVEDILRRHNGDVSWIPREWFAGPDGVFSAKEQAANPGQSVEGYVNDWMKRHEKNAGIAEDTEENKKKIEELQAQLVPLEEEIRKKLDSKTLEIYDKAGPEQKWNIEHAIRAVGVDKFNESVKEIAKTEKNVNETASVIADPNAKINTDTGRYDEKYYESIIEPFDIHSEREGSTTSLSAETKSRLGAMLRDAPDYVKEELKIQSAYRDPELQQQLYNRSGGSRYVAKNSQHSKGMAIDLGSGKGGSAQESWNNLSEETRSWIIQNSSKYGLYRPMQPGLTNVVEDWHFEPIGNRGNWQQNQPKANMSDWKDPQYTQTASQQPATNTSLSETTVATGPTVPSLASGGTIEMTPGENVAGINTNTGKVEFMSNDRELYTKDEQGNLRVDPSTIRQDEMPVQSAPTQNLEASTQPLQKRPEIPVPRETPDPNFVDIMTSGSMASSPSQLRALNRAKLYSENSSDLVNGHFS